MKVLVVDGDEAQRIVVYSIVESLGFQASMVADETAAWQCYEQQRAALVVLDLGHLGARGLDLCRRMRAEDPAHETFILVLTHDVSREDLQAVLDAGADDYMMKPTTPDNMRARLLIAQQRMAQASQRRAAEEALARSRWLAGIGETTIALQHEINNPLSALLGHAELMMMDAQDDGVENEHLRVILDQARRIAEVVKRLGRLRDPQTVEYVAGARMLDLSDRNKQMDGV